MQVLLTNPEIDELTYYLRAWTKRLLKLNKNQNNRIYHLERFKVTRRRFEGLLKKKEIDLLLLCGHGEEDKIEGEEEIILDRLLARALLGSVPGEAKNSLWSSGPFSYSI